MPERRRTNLAVALALAMLLALAAAAACAPLIANDRPLYARGIDRALVDDARARLPAQARDLGALLAWSEAEYLAQRRPGARQSHSEAIATAAAGVAARSTTLARHVEPELARVLREHARQALASAERFERGEREAALAPVRALEAWTGGWSDPTRDPARAGWRAAPRWPVFEAATRSDWFLLLAWPCAACWIWRARRRAADAEPLGAALARGVLALAGCALVACALFAWLHDERSARRADWKLALADGRFDALAVVHAPLAMGFSETHAEEAWLAPTWRRSARAAGVALEPLPGECDLESAWRHPLGTDGLGRDLAARLLWGARASLAVGFAAAALLTLVGVLVGALAGQLGGWFDWLALRGIEAALCIPALFLALAVLAFTDPRALDPAVAVVLVIGLVGWPGIARLLRAEIRRVRELDFARAARVAGLHPLRVLARHVLPHALPPVIVAASFAVGACLLTEAALSYLGLGVRPPLASWGALAAESRQLEHWWVPLFPGLAIFAAAAACNVLGEALRDRLDPRRREVGP
ncbi:MAG: ABC transporter permease [Planctomycetota bacterium]|nr:MAG: ABC transporter permease [Planctomycetota bacterium]